MPSIWNVRIGSSAMASRRPSSGASWVELERGVGGWYHDGRYLWGGPGAPSRRIDGLRGSVFSKDDKTPVRSPHFRGEPGWSWVAGLAPADAAFGE